MVNRFLRGILAKDAGLFALNNRYENLEKAIEAVQVYVENQRSVFGHMKIRALEDQGSSPEEDIARVRFQRKQGPTQERSTTVPMTPASNSITEGMEEVKKTLRDIQEAINRPMATQTKEIEKRWQMLEKNLEEIRKTIKPRELPRAVGGNRETTNKNEGRRTRSPTPEDIQCFRCQGRGHMARECPNLRARTPMGSRSPSLTQRVEFALNTNERM